MISTQHGREYYAVQQYDEAAAPTTGDAPIQATTKRRFESAEEYYDAHHAPPGVFVAAGWTPEIVMHEGREAVSFQTASGQRWRYTDGDKPTYHHRQGYKACWYGLKRALKDNPPVIVDCNGAASTVPAQWRGIPAFSLQMGEGTTPNEELLTELKDYSGLILVAFDCDDVGRNAAIKRVQAYRRIGLKSEAADLALPIDGGDLADFTALHPTDALPALLACQRLHIPDPEPFRQRFVASPEQSDAERIALAQAAVNALSSSRFDNYDDWVAVGMSLKALGEAGLAMWEARSANSDKFKGKDCVVRWRGFKGAKGLGSLFYMAKMDTGQEWPPKREKRASLDRPSLEMPKDIAAVVDAEIDRPWDEGMPVAVRGALNLYADCSVGPLLELWFEGIAKDEIPASDPITADCLISVSQKLGRKVTAHTIRAGLKQGAEHFLRDRAHYSISNIEDYLADTDPCAQIQNNCDPCRGQKGRDAVYYELLPRETILRNLARLAFPALVREQFPADGDLIAPILPEFIASLGFDNADEVADELDLRYHDEIQNQPGFKDAMDRVRKAFNKLLFALRNPRSAPIPADWTYANSTDYKACCARGIVEAAGGETQYGRTMLCKLIGCIDKMLKSILDRAGIAMIKNQVVDRAVRVIEDVRRIKREYDREMKGFPVAVVSTLATSVFSLKRRGLLTWAQNEINRGAALSIRFRQANKQILVEDLQPKKVKKVKPEPEIVVPEPELQPALLPEPIPAIVTDEPKELPAKKPRVKKESWAEMWIKKFADRKAPAVLAKAVDENGELAPLTVQLALDALLVASPPTSRPKEAPVWDADPLLDPDFLASIGATVTGEWATELETVEQ